MAFYPELAIAQWIFKPALQFIDYTENDVQNIGWTKKKSDPVWSSRLHQNIFSIVLLIALIHGEMHIW